MQRGVPIRWTWDCSEPYLKGKWVGIQDFYSPSEDTGYWTGIYEGVTDEGGVWKGTSDNKPPISLGTLKGKGNYKGLQMSMNCNLDTSKCKIRVTKLAGE